MRKYTPDLAIALLLLLLPLILFSQVTLGDRTLLPADNLYQWQPFATYREVVQAPDVPHNSLLSDLVLENYVWRGFVRESITNGELPLWNPHLFAGVPFFAAGQASVAYPLSLLYYVLPLAAAYGWYTVIQLWLAGLCMYAFTRGIGQGRTGATVAAVSWELAGWFVVQAVFPMILGASAWLPLLLLAVEFVIRARPLLGRPATLPWVGLGALGLALVIYAGHVEIMYYTLLIMGFYAAARLLTGAWAGRRTPGTPGRLLRRGVWLVVHGHPGAGIGGGPAPAAVRAGQPQLPRRLRHAGANSRLGLPDPSDRRFPDAELLRQPLPPRLLRRLQRRDGPRHAQRPGQPDHDHRLGDQELRRGRGLPGPAAADPGGLRPRRGLGAASTAACGEGRIRSGGGCGGPDGACPVPTDLPLSVYGEGAGG